MNAPHPQALPILAPLAKIHASPTNPRKRFNPDAHKEMVASVREHGVLQPVLLRPLPIDHGPKDMTMGEKLDCFELVSGERRYRAATEAGLSDILAVVRDLTDVQVLEIQIIENLQREDVHPLEEAEGYERLMKSGNYTLEHLMERIGKSRSYVYARLKLLALVPLAREAFYTGKLTSSTALLVARIPTEQQARAVKEITIGYDQEPLSFRKAVRHVEHNFMLELDKATFKTDDADYAAGPCTTCPKRTGNQPELFADIKSGDLCTDSACFNNKRETNYLRLKAIAEARGAKIIEGEAAQKMAPNGANFMENKAFVALDKTCYDLPGKTESYRKMLGKDFTPETFIKDPRTGELVPLVAKATIAEHLAAKGITLPGSRADKDKESERKAKAETAYREALLRTISVAYHDSATTEFNEIELRLIAEVLHERIGHDGRQRLIKLFGKRAIDTLEPTALLAFIIQCAVVSEVHVASYMTIGKPEKLIAIAENINVDHAAVKRDVQKALKTAKKPAKKPASPPSNAAQAAGDAPKETPPEAAPAGGKPTPKKRKAKASPAPAAPGNEAAAPPKTGLRTVATANNGESDPWPFPIKGSV